MKESLTCQQKLAIDCRGNSLLVSAAAGAGKTAVLVQRVLSLITDPQRPCGIDQLLVVTFTNAAAGEMRQRIGVQLRQLLASDPDNHHLRRQLALLGGSKIQTVHAFCQNLIREHFTLCGVDPDFRLADETQCAFLQEQALGEALEQAYQQNTPAFSRLCATLTDGRSDRALSTAVLDVYKRLGSHPDPEGLLELLPTLCAAEPEDLRWMQEVGQRAGRWLDCALKDLEKNRALAQTVSEVYTQYGPALEELLAFGQGLQAAIAEGWDAACACLMEFQKGKLRGCRYEDKAFLERIKAGRERFFRRIAFLQAECFFQPVQAIREEGQRTAPMVGALCALTQDFFNRYQAEKARRGLLDFNDLEHYALKLLQTAEGEPTPLALQLQGELREVLVDEYQDTNEIQERIFRALRGVGQDAFFVGDVKQSIYRFRLAEPEIFLDRYEASVPYTGKETGSVRLSLNRNFRSRPEVLSLCNAVFSRLMTRDFGDVDYDEDQRLCPGRKVQGNVPSEVLLLDCPSNPEKEEEEGRTVLEARLVARRVARLLREEQVPEKESSRPVRPEDIAILLSSFTRKAPIFRQELQTLGIPCEGGGGGEFFGTVETSAMLSLLRLLNNRRQDVPLVSVLRSPLYLASPDLLARLRLLCPEGDMIDGVILAAKEEPLCAQVLADLERWEQAAREVPLSQLIRLIYDDTGAEQVFSVLDGGIQRLRNLRRLEGFTRPFGGGAGGLSAFLRWIDRRLADGLPPEESEGGAGGVQLLSIHRSKGLEFPFVILPDLSKQFNTDDLKKPVMFHPDLGIGLCLRQFQERVEVRTQLQQAITLRARQELRGEELRKLYVAMTRAREKLILVMSDRNLTKKICSIMEETGGQPTPEWLVQQGDAMSWLIGALLSHPACGPMRAVCPDQIFLAEDSRREDLLCQIWSTSDLEEDFQRPLSTVLEKKESLASSNEYIELLEKSGMDYPFRKASALPSKLTPTGLRNLAPESGEVYGKFSAARARDYHAQPLARRDPDALLRGSAMHALLRWADLAACGTTEQVLEQAKFLEGKGYLSPEERALLQPKPVVWFARSALGKRTLTAEKVLREYQFSILMGAERLLKDGPTGERLLINGAIDLLLFEEKGLTVIDFKTDRVPAGTLQEKAEEHRLQLEMYAQAAVELFDLPVKEKWVWFLQAGKGVLLKDGPESVLW